MPPKPLFLKVHKHHTAFEASYVLIIMASLKFRIAVHTVTDSLRYILFYFIFFTPAHLKLSVSPGKPLLFICMMRGAC